MVPLTTKQQIKDAVEIYTNAVNSLKSIISKSEEFESVTLSDPEVVGKYDMLNQSVQGARKQGVKELLIVLGEKYREIGRGVAMGEPDPMVPAYQLYPSPFPHKEHVINAIDVQVFDAKVVLNFLVDEMPDMATTPTTTGADPRVTGVFNALLTDDQMDYKKSFMHAAFIYADNLVQLSAAWM